MKTYLTGIALFAVLTVVGGGRPAAAADDMKPETPREYCSAIQAYDLGSREYRECVTMFIAGYCNAMGHKVGSDKHTACVTKLRGQVY